MVRHAGFGEASLWRGEAFDTAERLLVPPEIESSVFREEHHGGAWDLWAQRLAPSNRAKRDTPAHCRALERCERLIIGPFEVQVGLSSSRCAERTRNSVAPYPGFTRAGSRAWYSRGPRRPRIVAPHSAESRGPCGAHQKKYGKSHENQERNLLEALGISLDRSRAPSPGRVRTRQ